ncbi:fungal-specific transcription factor domain-containing protein [Peziza echinospora]|nr:fungal-specific transcription factor domain-containing protein [Peziza echinospora]
MSNNTETLPSPSADTPNHQQQQQQQQQQQSQQQQQQQAPTSEVGNAPAIESVANIRRGERASVPPEVPSVVMPAVTELVSGRVSPRSMLHVVPEQKRPKVPGLRRAFQPRRRSRACDQCRTRKTKCDTPNDGPCSSCVAASLECHFSEGGDERRRAGPTRRLRAYEALTKELQDKLDRANAILVSLGYAPIISSASLALTTPSSPSVASLPDRSGGYTGRSTSTFMGSSPITPGQPQNMMRMGEEAQDFMGTPFTSTPTAQMSGFLPPGSMPNRRSPEEQSAWDAGSYGPGSFSSFLSNYREYLVRLGFAPPPLIRRLSQGLRRPSQNGNDTIPSATENIFADLPTRWPLPARDESEVDLRSLLPDKQAADECKEVYRKTLQKYLPAFYWSMMEDKWKRAWEQPIWEWDKEAKVGLEIQLVWKKGWVYFLMANHFHDEYPQAYHVDDATIFLLMSIYLMNASLPSPSWMMIGATCRVFQDLGLHKCPPPNQISKIEQECRNRLFWASYVLDRQIGIVFGRPVIYKDQEIEVNYPGQIYDFGAGAMGEERDASSGDDAYSPEDRFDIGLQSYRALIQVCRCFQRVRSAYAREEGSENDILRVREVEHELDKAWDLFPPELKELSSSQPLEVAALRPLLDAQHTRLLLYRSFTDFSKPLRTAWRTFCLAQSIHTCKVSARLILRCTYQPDWDNEFALKSNETIRSHTFRAAALLLLGYSLNDPALERVDRDEVMICIKALKAASERHVSMKKPMQMVEGLAKMFGCDIQDVQGPLERQEGAQKDRMDQGSRLQEVIRAPSDPMEWANYPLGEPGEPKPRTPDTQGYGIIQSQIPQHGIPYGDMGQPSTQPPPSQYLMRDQSGLFPPSQYDPSSKSGYQTGPGNLRPLVTDPASTNAPGIPGTPGMVSSLGGLILSPSLNTPTSNPMSPMPMSPGHQHQQPPQRSGSTHRPRDGMRLFPPQQQQQQHPQEHQQQRQQQQQPPHGGQQPQMQSPSQHLLSPSQNFQPPPADLSSAGAIDWDAFQNMMAVDNHGFGELLAAGPELSWGGYLPSNAGAGMGGVNGNVGGPGGPDVFPPMGEQGIGGSGGGGGGAGGGGGGAGGGGSGGGGGYSLSIGGGGGGDPSNLRGATPVSGSTPRTTDSSSGGGGAAGGGGGRGGPQQGRTAVHGEQDQQQVKTEEWQGG